MLRESPRALLGLHQKETNGIREMPLTMNAKENSKRIGSKLFVTNTTRFVMTYHTSTFNKARCATLVMIHVVRVYNLDVIIFI